MAGIAHNFGGDLSVSPLGDVATADAITLSQQRILRRLLTNPGDNIWHPEYGAGLRRYIGLPISVPDITAVIRTQIGLEASVAKVPAPVIVVTSDPNGAVFASIQYTDAGTQQTQVLTVPLSN